MPDVDTCQFEEILTKTNVTIPRTTFPHYKSKGPFYAPSFEEVGGAY